MTRAIQFEIPDVVSAPERVAPPNTKLLHFCVERGRFQPEERSGTGGAADPSFSPSQGVEDCDSFHVRKFRGLVQPRVDEPHSSLRSKYLEPLDVERRGRLRLGEEG